MTKTELILNKEFNGTTDFISAPTLAPNPDQGTIIVVFTPYDNRRSLIFYTGPTTSGNGLGSEDEFNIITDYIPGWSSLSFYWGSTAINGNFYVFDALNNYVPNTEYHLAIRYKNNGVCDTLVNGFVTNSDDVSKTIDTSTWGQTIIGKPTENTRYFKGFIKRVVVADYIMTDAEVMADYSPICNIDYTSKTSSLLTIPGVITMVSWSPLHWTINYDDYIYGKITYNLSGLLPNNTYNLTKYLDGVPIQTFSFITDSIGNYTFASGAPEIKIEGIFPCTPSNCSFTITQ